MGLIDAGHNTQRIADYYGITVDELMEYYNTIKSGAAADAAAASAETISDPFAGTGIGTNAKIETEENINSLVDMIADGTTTTADVAARFGLDEAAVIAEYTGIMDDRLAAANQGGGDEVLASGNITGVAGTNELTATQEDINALVDGVVSGDFTAQGHSRSVRC